MPSFKLTSLNEGITLMVKKPITQPVPPKFILRQDLTLEIRSAIACQAYLAQTENNWGAITGLAREYRTSRPFIYSLLNTFKEGLDHLLFPKKKPTPISRETVEARILFYRFEARASIDGISTLLKRDGIPFSAHGLVSEYLTQTGKSLPNCLENEKGAVQFVAFANDEVFAKSQPILITVDPVSSAILRIELTDKRTADKWSNHYHCLLDNGFTPDLLTSDAGVAICAANKETLANVPWQLDTFHSVAHRLGLWDRKLEKAIDTATHYATEREKTLDSAKSDAVIEKRLNRCCNAEDEIKEARGLHHDFHYLYTEIIHQLNSFDSRGELRKRNDAEETIEVALDLMESLDYKPIRKDISSVRNALPDFLTYFTTAEKAVKNCQNLSDNKDALSALYYISR